MEKENTHNESLQFLAQVPKNPEQTISESQRFHIPKGGLNHLGVVGKMVDDLKREIVKGLRTG